MNTNTMRWSFIPMSQVDYHLPVKSLYEDSETGMMIMKMKYDAGFVNPWHTHNCAHGMYVLDGILQTSKGDYGPGEFVWFSEGERMFHGATKENDVNFLFITNKSFDITYEGK